MSNEFKYTREWTDEGAFPLLGFTKNWENPADYPTYEPDEMQVRKDMQSLHDEVKDFLNNELIPRVVAEDATVEAWTYAEEQRAANEVTRVANEEQRVANEAARVAAESGRTAAEQARALAEQGRVDSTTGIVAQATEQARAASSSAVYAAESASAASASAAEATQQAGTAFTWSSHAEQAANHAAAAANGADDSRIRAEESAGQAAASASSAARSESEAKRYAEQASSAGAGDMLQSVYDPTYKRQDIFKYANTKISEHNSSTSAHADIRTALDGKAPVGPPMEIGVEYQTAERYMGKPVFATLVNAGSLPDSTTKNVAHGISNIEYVFDCRGVTSGGDSLPYVVGNSRIDITAGKTNVSVCTNYGAPASMSAYITIRYTKRA